MLLLPDLISFADAFVASRPNLEDPAITVMDDDETGKLYKDVANANNLCTLITVVPSHDGAGNDEDNTKMQNNLTFFIIKKTDDKAGNKKKMDHVAICQLEVLALAEKIKTLVGNFGEDCIFKDIDLNTIQITPVNNYFKGSGFMIDFATKTDY